jgi:hypothetical protein
VVLRTQLFVVETVKVTEIVIYTPSGDSRLDQTRYSVYPSKMLERDYSGETYPFDGHDRLQLHNDVPLTTPTSSTRKNSFLEMEDKQVSARLL